MRNTLLTVSTLASIVTLAACGGNEPAKDPSSESTSPTSGITSTPSAAGPGDSAAAMPASEGAKPAAGAPASPMEGKCKSGAPAASVKDFDSCLSSCKGLDDQVPPGSRCISAKTSCVAQCNTKYKKP